MALRKILTKEDEVLHAVCKPVEVFDENNKILKGVEATLQLIKKAKIF